MTFFTIQTKMMKKVSDLYIRCHYFVTIKTSNIGTEMKRFYCQNLIVFAFHPWMTFWVYNSECINSLYFITILKNKTLNYSLTLGRNYSLEILIDLNSINFNYRDFVRYCNNSSNLRLNILNVSYRFSLTVIKLVMNTFLSDPL